MTSFIGHVNENGAVIFLPLSTIRTRITKPKIYKTKIYREQSFSIVFILRYEEEKFSIIIEEKIL